MKIKQIKPILIEEELYIVINELNKIEINNNIHQQAIIEGVDEILTKIKLIFNNNEYNFIENNFVEIQEDLEFEFYPENIISPYGDKIIHSFDCLENKKKKLLKTIFSNSFKINQSRFQKYILTGINNDSSIHYLAKVKLSQYILKNMI